MSSLSPIPMLRPRRKITGMSAVLLPFLATGEIDWGSLRAQIRRTQAAGLVPAVNMDTGYANLIDEAVREQILVATREELGGSPFVAGAFVADWPGSPFNRDAYAQQIARIAAQGGTPVIFQSYGLTSQTDEELVSAYEWIGTQCDRFIGFELGTMFAPFGRIYSLDVYRGMMQVKQCLGAKHSSLSRQLEWDRIQLRDQVRPEFLVLTGNDLAIDMVMYGSDYLLGLSTFSPDLFAQRDAYWEAGDPRFYELNDLLQYLGCFAFRDPVPAYKHSAAMFLKLRGWIETDLTHPRSATRPDSDREVLATVVRQLEGPSKKKDE